MVLDSFVLCTWLRVFIIFSCYLFALFLYLLPNQNMKIPAVAATTVVMAVGAASYPGMKETLDQISSRAEEAAEQTEANQPKPELLGDLEHLPECSLTPTGSAIKHILLGQINPQDLFSTYVFVPRKDTPECAADTCCIWKYIADELKDAMVGTAGRCNKLARGAIRLGFHDAGGWSRNTGPYGGADGSILLANECEERRENGGLEGICAQMRVWYDKWKGYGISMADLIQMAATVGAVVCPQGPRVRSFVGRKDNPTPAPHGNLPSPFASADSILAMFAAKTISARGIVALLGAHTASQQFKVYANRTGAPQDTTPGVWDTVYFRETMADKCPDKVVRFVSDTNLAADARTSAHFGDYADEWTGQHRWNRDYAREYVRLSLLGVPNINELTECTKVLPPFTGTRFVSPDAALLARYAAGEEGMEYAAAALEAGDLIPEK